MSSGSSGKEDEYENVELLEDYYTVEKILDKKRIGSTWKYKVKWEGYSEDECTWEPAYNLANVKDLLEDFEKKYNKNNKNKKQRTEKSINNISDSQGASSLSNMIPEEFNYNDITYSDGINSIKNESEKKFIRNDTKSNLDGLLPLNENIKDNNENIINGNIYNNV